jgi:hypothetical protein
MPDHAMTRLRAALTLAPIALSFAAAGPASADVQIQTGVSGMNYGTATASALACRAGTAGSWLEANGVTVEGAARRMSLTFSAPLATDTLRAAMNGAGARNLALVEIQGTDGVWHKAWEGQLAAPAPGFEPTCFEQRLPQKQMVQALRYTFRSAQDQVEVNHAALLRR